MSLCLLSRGLQNIRLFNFGYCFRLTKVMNALRLDSVLLQSPSSTSQQRQQESLRRRGSLPPLSGAEHSTNQSAAWRLACKGLLANRLASSSSSDYFASTSTLSGDRFCLVCGAHSSMSCPVCDEDFCSNHLYQCLDCDNQYCGRCLDDHRADGHWSDSDTAAELNHGRVDRFVPDFHNGKDGFAAASNRAQCFCSEQAASQSYSIGLPLASRHQPLSRLSQRNFLTRRLSRAFCCYLASFAASRRVNMFPQSDTHLEACR